MKTFYDFVVKDINGNDFHFSSLKGKKVLIVNTASECGFTKQYTQLEELYQKYKDKNFVIIAFPANQFSGQEPGTNQEIAHFCTRNFGVTFPIMAKSDVKGNNANEVFKFLTTKKLNGVKGSFVLWNFQKYLVDETGNYVNYYLSTTSPTDKLITNWLDKK